MRIVEGAAAKRVITKLAQRKATISVETERRTSRIVKDVQRSGDVALRRYAHKLDGLMPKQELRVSPEEMKEALGSISPELRRALAAAAKNIRRFCEWQRPKEWWRESLPGVRVGQLVRPLGSVGCYVPGGRYPLPSSLLMTVIPAQVAGVQRIVVASPRPAPEVLAAAQLLGVTEFYRVGGAQAIAALAYGTQTVNRVEKIVGPGNAYVTAAKKAVAFDCDIDFLAGPTEALVLTDDGEPRYIAADLLAQAEHDADAISILITSSRELAKKTVSLLNEMARQTPTARESLRRNGYAIITQSVAEAIEAANRIAPEHLTVSEPLLSQVRSAGSIFVGDYSAQAIGDYFAGPNHVLPTGAGARNRGGLNVLDFVKIITVQQLTKAGVQRVAPFVEVLADAEGLFAHAASVRVRCAHA